MPGKTPSQAVDAFLRPLDRAISCVSRIPLHADGRSAGKTHMLTWNNDRPVLLKARHGQIRLELRMGYEIVPAAGERGPWKVATRVCTYSVHASDGADLLTYHWHPATVREHRPHAHVGSAVLRPDAAITRKTHLPTGRTAIETVLRMCIKEFGVQSLREDWEHVLTTSEDSFKKWQTWH